MRDGLYDTIRYCPRGGGMCDSVTARPHLPSARGLCLLHMWPLSTFIADPVKSGGGTVYVNGRTAQEEDYVSQCCWAMLALYPALAASPAYIPPGPSVGVGLPHVGVRMLIREHATPHIRNASPFGVLRAECVAWRVLAYVVVTGL